MLTKDIKNRCHNSIGLPQEANLFVILQKNTAKLFQPTAFP
jgi:hypothetical protein